MQNHWLEERKELFLKELVKGFLESKVFFDKLHAGYKKKGVIPYERMEFWIGSETKKGPLWILKDNCHKLFRKPDSKISLSEYLFDWTLGSIFHEGMKLKEDVYQLEVYLPSSEAVNTSDNTDELQKIFREYLAFINRAAKNIESEMASINHLFLKAVEILQEILKNYATNGLLIRFLLENDTLLNRALGKNTSGKIFSSLFPNQPEQGFIIAGANCFRGGWFREASEYFRKALKINPRNTEAKQWLNQAEKKL